MIRGSTAQKKLEKKVVCVPCPFLGCYILPIQRFELVSP